MFCAEHAIQQDHKVTGDVTKALIPADPEVLSWEIDNLINLNDLNENAILHNLRLRYKAICFPHLNRFQYSTSSNTRRSR